VAYQSSSIFDKSIFNQFGGINMTEFSKKIYTNDDYDDILIDKIKKLRTKNSTMDNE